MRVYLAARYSRRQEMVAVANDLARMGHDVTSRWILGTHDLDARGLSVEAEASERIRFAQEDWSDLMAARLCISFTEAPRSANSRGGRHVEFGAALAKGLLCAVVGPRENVFHCLPQVHVYPTWSQCRDALFFAPVAALAERGQGS